MSSKGIRNNTMVVEGLNDLQRSVKKVDKGLGKEMTKAVKSALLPVVTEAKGQVDVQSSALRNTIKAFASNRIVGIQAGSKVKGAHAGIEHYGVRSLEAKDKNGKPLGLRDANPFMQKPVFDMMDQTIDSVVDVFKDYIRKAGIDVTGL